jgi:hypothetical protein
MNLELRVRKALSGLLHDTSTDVAIDSVVHNGEVLLVTFHLEGAWASPAAFTFPFAEFVPLEESLANLRDLISRNWQRAHLPPPVVAAGGITPPSH